MHLRMIVSALFLFTTACTAPASDPSSQNPGDTGDEVGEVNHARLPGGDVDGQRDAVPMDGLEIDLSNPGEEEAPFEVIMPQEPEQPANPDLPECLEIPGAAGCAGEPVAPNLEDWECPDGWRALEVSEATGHSNCVAPPASACPEGDWAEYTGTGNVIYVQPGGVNYNWVPNGNMGFTQATALGTINSALDLVYDYHMNTSTVIDAVMIAKGDYGETINVDQNVRLIGACSDETRITSNDGLNYPAVWMVGDVTTSLEKVSIHGQNSGIYIIGTASATLKNVDVYGQMVRVDDYLDYPEYDLVPTQVTLTEVTIRDSAVGESGLEVYGVDTVVNASDIVIDNFQGHPAYPYTNAIFLHDSQLTMQRASIEGGYYGIYNVGGNLDLSQALLLDQQEALVASMGGQNIVDQAYVDTEMGLAFFEGSQFSVTDSYFETQYDGVYVDDSSGNLERVRVDGAAYGFSAFGESQVTVADMEVTGANLAAFGVLMGASVDAERVRLRDNFNVGLDLWDPGTTVHATDLIIENTNPLQNATYCGCLAPYLGWFGYGISIYYGASLTGDNITVNGSHDSGIWLYGDGSRMDVSDLLIADTHASGGQGGGFGIYAVEDSQIFVERGKIARSDRESVYVEDAYASLSQMVLEDAGAQVDFTDPDVSDEDIEVFGGSGKAITGLDGAYISASRVIAKHAKTAGIWLSGFGTVGIFEDLKVSDVEPGGIEESGQGIMVAAGARIEANRVEIARTRDSGVWFQGEGTTGVMSNVYITLSKRDYITQTRGNGVHVTGKAKVDIFVGKIDMSEGSGIVAMGEGSKISMEDILIVGKRDLETGSVEIDDFDNENESIESSASVEMGGDGLAVVHGAQAAMTRGVIMKNGRAGVLISDDAALGLESVAELQEVQVVENSIGICVNSESFSVESSFSEVSSENNSVESSVDAVEVQPEGAVETSMASVEMSAAQTNRQ